MIETHFGVFVALALCTGYRRVSVVLVGLVTVAVHHISFNYLQSLNIGIYLFANGPSWAMVLLHAVYATAEALILVYFALIQATHDILRQPGIINLGITVDSLDHPVVNDFRGLIGRIRDSLAEAQRYSDAIAETMPRLQANARESLQEAVTVPLSVLRWV